MNRLPLLKNELSIIATLTQMPTDIAILIVQYTHVEWKSRFRNVLITIPQVTFCRDRGDVKYDCRLGYRLKNDRCHYHDTVRTERLAWQQQIHDVLALPMHNVITNAFRLGPAYTPARYDNDSLPKHRKQELHERKIERKHPTHPKSRR